MQECKKCIQNSKWPGIKFNNNGICSNCLLYDDIWNKTRFQGEDAFRAILKKYKSKKSSYDVIVGVSGGKDSCYALHVLSRYFGTRILAFTYDNGFLDKGARDNIHKITDSLGIECRFINFDNTETYTLYSHIIKNKCSDICQICVAGVIAAANRIAIEEKVKLVIVPSAPRTEPVALPPLIQCVNDYRYLNSSAGPLSNKSKQLFKHMNILNTMNALLLHRIHYVLLPDYIDWDSKDIALTLKKEYDWIDYGQGKRHFDCQIHQAIEYFRIKRFGVNVGLEELSLRVRSGDLSRDEAKKEWESIIAAGAPEDSINKLQGKTGVSAADIKPYLLGQTKTYTSFRSCTNILHIFSPLLWILSRLNLVSKVAWLKYK